MAMSPSSMKSKIEAAMAALGIPAQEGDFNQLLALCTGIIQEITQNGLVNPGIAVATSGGPSSQAGATTAPGVIS